MKEATTNYGLIVDQKFGYLPELIEQSYPRTDNATRWYYDWRLRVVVSY